MNLNIRQARPSDVAVIADFNARLAQETEHRQLDVARLAQGVGALLSDPVKGTYFVAEMDGEVVGQLLITYEWSDWRNGHFWWIQSVYVKEALRSRGIFRALFAHVQKLAKARKDVCGLRLYMDAHNATARKTYERLGLKQTNYELFELEFVLTK
ncbi:MAG: GNAT family N-acetyltransferase [Verrucomicrobia bacterium]|nr:GNAT family N-acetyltransferase [Verrucomicrobiota bacterium]